VTKSSGSIATPGSVSRLFHRKGQIIVSREAAGEDQVMEAALEAGAEDFARDGDQYVVSTTVTGFHAVQDALRARQVEIESAEIAMVPKTTVKVEGKQAEQMIRLLEALEELDDVSKVFSNFDIDSNQLAEASS
jgi:transcriptional/translational regulatory protein YebC/TACO1